MQIVAQRACRVAAAVVVLASAPALNGSQSTQPALPPRFESYLSGVVRPSTAGRKVLS